MRGDIGDLSAPAPSAKAKRKRMESLKPSRAAEESQEATSSVNFDESQVKQEPPESSSSPGPAAGGAEEEESPDSQQVVICPLCTTCLPNIAQFVTHMTVAHGGAAAAAAAASFAPGSGLFDLPSSANRLLGASLPSYLASPFLMGQNLCLLCGGLVTSLDSAMLHLMNHYIQSKTVHACAQCSLQCHSAEELARHNLAKHCAEVFKCTICGDILASKEEREKHFRKRHLSEKQVGVCVFCPQEHLADAKEAYRHLYAKHLMAYYDKYGDVLRPSGPAGDSGPASEAEEPPKAPAPPPAGLEGRPEKGQSPLKSLDLSPNSKSPVWSAAGVTNSAAVSPPALPGHAVSKLLNLFKEESTRRCSMCHKVFEDEMSVLRHQMQAHRTEEAANAANAASLSSVAAAVAAAAAAAASSAASSDAATSTSGASEAAKGGGGPWHTQYKCSYCEEAFKRPLELERHVRVHYSTQEAKCNICDELFPSAKVLAQHKKQQHQRGPPEAGEAIVSSSGRLLQRYRAVAARLLGEAAFEKEGAPPAAGVTCPVCEAGFESAFQLDIHMIGHKEAPQRPPKASPPPPGAAAAAAEAGKGRPVRDSPIFRVAGAKPGQDGKYVCQICDRSFADEGALGRHREEHISSLVKKARTAPAAAPALPGPCAAAGDSPVGEEDAMSGTEDGEMEGPTGPDKNPNPHHYKCVRCKRIFKSWKDHFIHRKSKKCKIKL